MADLIYEVKDHLARITLNRPKQLNCFSEEMIHLWTEALEDIRDRDDIYAVLLSGNGKAFCAGGDVKAMAAGDGFFESHEDISSTALARKNSLWKGIQRIPLILEEIDRPVIAKIHGPAVGAGLDMALMCDVRIASESATLSESYFNAGIVPGDGGAYFLPRLIGRDKALDLFWTTKVLKGAEAERQRRRRERDRSREMAAYVGYDAMYKDGIAQVMPGVFSQTVEFSDISYQSARKEARETAFTVMSSLFNYFPADSHVQLQVVNAPIPADEVGRKVFFEPGERATAGLAEEYNRILNDKMREGVSNLVRHRYLTYAVGADDVDAAVPRLARIRGDVEQTLARIRCSSRALDGAERLKL